MRLFAQKNVMSSGAPNKLSNAQSLNRNDANAQSVSKSIPNDLEDAKGNLCGSVIHKGQMFLSTGKTLQVV